LTFVPSFALKAMVFAVPANSLGSRCFPQQES
jgi:hypothetical protein